MVLGFHSMDFLFHVESLSLCVMFYILQPAFVCFPPFSFVHLGFICSAVLV